MTRVVIDVICLTNVYNVRLFQLSVKLMLKSQCEEASCVGSVMFYCFTFGFSYTSMVIMNSVLYNQNHMHMHSEDI